MSVDRPRLTVGSPADLGPSAVVRVAREGVTPVPSEGLVRRVAERSARVRRALAEGGPVYGVTTGMGALSGRALTEDEQARHQEALMLARSAGGPPWLEEDEARAVLAVRLRTFLNNDSGVSAELCLRLSTMLERDLVPAVPRTGMGVAGEIIALAHLAAPVSGGGALLPRPGGDSPASFAPGATRPAGPALREAGLSRLRLGPKEGVALIQGVPVTTALAVLCAHDARRTLRRCLLVLAAEIALTGASRDSFHPALARGDDVLAALVAETGRLAGSVARPRALQPPVSFRVSAQVLAHLDRSVTLLEAAVGRALDGITDSPAYLEETPDTGPGGTPVGGRFVGTAGFSGYDLAAHLHMLTVALVGAAEAGTTRLHRLMDPAVTGLPPQLSADPGPHTGLSPVHKQAVGIAHRLRRLTVPSTVGPVETSAGQEDLQSFSLEAADACRDALTGLTDVLACELLAAHQMRCLGARLPADAGDDLASTLDAAAAVLPDTPGDRPFGLDLTALRALLAARP